MIKYLLLPVIILIFLSGCKKDHLDNTAAAANIQVPAYTEKGANTFGCMVSGKPWANFGAIWTGGLYSGNRGQNIPNEVESDFGTNSAGDSAFFVSGELTVQQNGRVIRDETMDIEVPKKGNLKGTHQLTLLNYLFDYRANTDGGVNAYSLIRNPFTVIIKKDSIENGKHIVSGTFYGMLYNLNQSNIITDSLRVTGGVFDVKVK